MIRKTVVLLLLLGMFFIPIYTMVNLWNVSLVDDVPLT